MRVSILVGGVTWLAAAALVPLSAAKDGQLRVRSEGTNTLIQVQGSGNEDWRLQTSPNLATWTNLASFGTLLSGGTNAPWRSVGGHLDARRYYRALKTGGLYDPTLLRTISLTFTQADWSNALALARTYGTNVYCSRLTMDNGATNTGLGARYRGGTSFTGVPPGPAPMKKSLSVEVDYTDPNADLMSYSRLNLNNAYQDETIMREAVYFNVMRNYTVCPAAGLAQLRINGENRGVYSQVQQQNNSLIKEYFPSNDGDRWEALNVGDSSAFNYLGDTNPASYASYYALKSDYNTNAWPRLVNAIYLFNTTATNVLRDQAEDVLAVDRWLWFLALQNIFAEDGYWSKGAEYLLYYEPESGRIHPVEQDGNDVFLAGDASLPPLQGLAATNRPIISRLLAIPELHQRYLAHMRTVLQELFAPAVMSSTINQYVALSVAAIAADPFKDYPSMATYTNDLVAFKTFVTNRYNYLMAHAELTPQAPDIVAVYAPTSHLTAGQVPFVTAKVQAKTTNGLNSVWLYHRGADYGRFRSVQMFDDGAHGDGAAGDGLFGAPTTNYTAGRQVRYYVEARSANPAKAAAFSPPRAEQETFSYRVGLATAPNTPVVLNEFMADNSKTLADPQGECDDWIELHNVTEQSVSVAGFYLSDDPANLHMWQFPPGTTIAANGFLLVWADQQPLDTPGLHTNFKLSKSGDQIYLTATNTVLDSVSFGVQQTDVSYGRASTNADVWVFMYPTPNAPNR